jgi:hypothetical protein
MNKYLPVGDATDKLDKDSFKYDKNSKTVKRKDENNCLFSGEIFFINSFLDECINKSRK